MKKNSCTPINPKKYSCLWPKKNSCRDLIPSKNSCGSRIPHPSYNFSNGPYLFICRRTIGPENILQYMTRLMFVECHRWFFLKPRCDRIQHGRWRRLAAVIFSLQYLQRLRFSCLLAMVWKTLNCFWSSVLFPPLISQLNVRWTWV